MTTPSSPSGGEEPDSRITTNPAQCRSEADQDDVTVHVTPRGGFYVNERELLRSKAAQEMMAKMASIFDEEHHERGARKRR